ncbi:B-block binding subunit of TFIIIC [Macleaya cordata]|uniref:B-block binding subunit of TFIIIC n=1 Tax=Macleaya cordata TaxID=56857 RepID=A0A200Q847_MACCD|nr:B-block binding subunit of TFIIIC [Macleaya cordata]
MAMDSIVSAALSEICSQGVNGISLTELWPKLHNSLCSSGFTNCDGIKTAIWKGLLNIPVLQFEANELSFCSQDPSIESFEEAEKLGLRIVAAEDLRDSFYGLYDLKAADAGISPRQRRILERIASARSNGITQRQLAKDFGMEGNNIFYIVRNLECQGLIVRQSTIVRTKEAATEQDSGSKNTSIVNTNLIHLYRYAKHLNSQQRLEITTVDRLENLKNVDGSTSLIGDGIFGDHVKDDIVIKDYLAVLKAVCQKLEEADDQILLVSDIKQALRDRWTLGHKAWRNIFNKLKDAHLVEEFCAKVNRKKGSCLHLLKKFDQKHFQPKPVLCGSDDFNIDQSVQCGNKEQITEQLLELPIEHQIHDMIAAESTKGLTVTEVCKRLGINSKRNYTLLRNMFSRFGCHLQAESHNRSFHYRVWTSGNFTSGSSTALPGKSAAGIVQDDDLSSKQSVMDLVLNDTPDVALVQLDSLSFEEEVLTTPPGKMESRQMGLELGSSPPTGNGESKQQMRNCGSRDPHDLVGESGEDAAHDSVQNKSNVAPPKTPSPPSSNPSRLLRSHPRQYPRMILTAASAQREQRILERLQEDKFVLTVELYRLLESLEKDKLTKIDRKTLARTLNKLQNEGHCKCFSVSVPDFTNFGRERTTGVVLHKSIPTLTPQILGQIPERLRSFDMHSRGQGLRLARLKNEKTVSVLTGIKRIFTHDISSDSKAVRVEAMRANGFVISKLVRAELLHKFLWGYLSSSHDWGNDALSSGRHGYDLKNPHSSCKLFALNVAMKAMPLELFLQVVGSTQKFEDLIESCKCALRLSDLSMQDYKSLMDTQATRRFSWIIDILRRLKLIRLVTDGHAEDADMTPHATILTYAMELKPYIEEPFSRVPLSFGVNSFDDLRPRIRHDFILSNKDAVDIYWDTLENCYATADPKSAVLAFPGSAVKEVQCQIFSGELWLLHLQVLRVSNGKGQSHLHRFQRDFNCNKQELQPGTSKNRSTSRKRKKYLEAGSSKHIKCLNGKSGGWKMPSLSESNGQYTEEENTITTHTGDHDIEQSGTNGEDREENYDFISQCASKLKPTRQSKFLWTETSDRQLVIQYVRYHAALGARFYPTRWVTLPDLPAPPETCKRRMGSLKNIQTVWSAVMRLCNLLGERYANHLNKSKEKELLNHDDSGHNAQDSSIEECFGKSFSNCLARSLESDFKDQRWDDFEDQNVRGALDEVLRCIRMAKVEGSKRARPSPEKEWPDGNLDSQACDFQELDLITPTTNASTGEEIENHVGKRRRRSSCSRVPGKFLKLLDEGTSVSRREYESLAVANAVELLKLVFFSTSTAPEVLTLLAETLRHYSEYDLFAAFNYLKEKKFMVGGNGSQPFVLSQQFLHSVSSSPFPINTGKRASKFDSWLAEREKDLMEEEGVHLNADLQCGDIFQLLALVALGELFISPCLPDEGIGESEDKRCSGHKTSEDELCSGNQVVKKPASLLMTEAECGSRREKGFPGIKISLFRATIPRADTMDFFKNEEIGTSSSRFDGNDQSTCYALGTTGSLFLSNQLNSSGNVISGTLNEESPWKAITRYGESLMSSLSNVERVGPLYPESFQIVHSTIRKSGDQGLRMEEVSQVTTIEGKMMAELVVDVLQVFGLVVKVNAYDCVRVVDASFRSKYFLSSTEGRYQDLERSLHVKSPRISDGNYLKVPQEHVQTCMDLDVVHKVTILNLPKEVSQLSYGVEPRKENDGFQDGMQVEVVSPEQIKESRNLKCTNSGHSRSFRPILPWMNGDGTMNAIVYKGLTRRVLGTVMQNPGILEDDIIHRMDALNPQSCRTLLELMVLDNHLIVRKKMDLTASNGGPPATLRSLFGGSSCFKKPESICRHHFFANPMSASLL